MNTRTKMTIIVGRSEYRQLSKTTENPAVSASFENPFVDFLDEKSGALAVPDFETGENTNRKVTTKAKTN